MKNKKELTFIVPIKNRPKQLKRLLNNCKKVFYKKIKYNLIIIDASNSENQKKNNKILKKNKNYKIIIQKNRGITIGCFKAIPHVKTHYCTFLYDDDELGKYLHLLFKDNLKGNDIFSMGTGTVQDINKKIKFKSIKPIILTKEKALLNYFGTPLSKTNREFKGMLSSPVSPISTCFKSKYLYSWKKHILKFVKNNKFRNYFLLEKDIGPDLIIYLHNILHSNSVVNFFTPHVVKFSSHPDSISIIYGVNNLRIGYWLARISVLDDNFLKKTIDKNYLYTYVILVGYYLLFTNINNIFFFKNILDELFKLHMMTKLKFSFKYMFLILKIWYFNRK